MLIGARKTFRSNRLARLSGLGVALVGLLWVGPVQPPGPPRSEEVSFDRDVRPILSEYCFQCHGPDARARKARLRLDTREGLFAARKHGAPIVPGKPGQSLLFQRVTAHDPDDRMPPASTKRRLSPEQIEVLRAWVQQGAPWQTHWAFVPPVRPELPPSGTSNWPLTSIDRFVLARLREAGLQPAAQADRRRLLRRVTLDLTGLPPSPTELAAFVADRAEGVFERVVDRLLASPRYGERMAWDWLDAARYADTNGFQGDQTRTMWPYRDWVVEALNDNLPYEKFLIWQLAGDLLPEPSIEQRLATAFTRNHMINGEGGRIPEENRVEYIFDSIETVSTIWLGLTMTCARCHDHKFDPLTQSNYYQLFAYFNQTPVTGGGGNPQTPPVLTVRNAADTAKLSALETAFENFECSLREREQTLIPGQEEWERGFARRRGAAPESWTALQPVGVQSDAGQDMNIEKDRAVLVSGKNPANDTFTVEFELPAGRFTGLRLEALQHPSMTRGGLARSNSGNFVLTEIELAWWPGGRPGGPASRGARSRPIKIASAVATYEQKGFAIRGVFDGKRNTGWAVHKGGFVDRAHTAVFRFNKPIDNKSITRLVITLRHDSVHASHILGRFRLSVTGETTPSLVDKGAALFAALRGPRDRRTKADSKLIESAYFDSDQVHVDLRKDRDAVRKRRDRLRKSSGRVKVMVMADRPGKPRKTHVLYKGLYNQRRSEVTAGVPEVLPPLPAGAPANRLSLARWLVDPAHPLTARVTVNRHWQRFFGTGLVKTVEDFGAQGAKPSHPDLLAWLATEFIRSGWDVKALHRLIVCSATYRQTASATPAEIEADPDNRRLARGPRHRLPSWMIRDSALAVSGLLVERLGGPPVKPYQPKGIWAEATFGKTRYKADKGEKLYRRSLYTFWRRIIGPTMFFDSAKRQTCSVSVHRTNTPLHALVTLNDVTYVEAARALAQRLLLSEGRDTRARLSLGFELATSRRPTAVELEILSARLVSLRREYAGQPAQAVKLLAVGAFPRDKSLDPVEHAAWTGVCSLILNLDETLNN